MRWLIGFIIIAHRILRLFSVGFPLVGDIFGQSINQILKFQVVVIQVSKMGIEPILIHYWRISLINSEMPNHLASKIHVTDMLWLRNSTAAKD